MTKSGSAGSWLEWLHRAETFLLDRLARWSAQTSPLFRKKVARLMAVSVYSLLGIRVSHVVEMLIERLNLSPEKARQLARQVYISFFENALEMASLPYLTKEQVNSRLLAVGLSNLEEAYSRGRGIVLISGHYGLWELVPPWLHFHGFPITSVVRRQSNRFADQWMEWMRTSHGAKTTDSGFGLRDILRTLKKGHLIGLMSDQDAGDKGIFVPFLGRLASTVVGPAQIAQKVGCPIVVCAGHPSFEVPHRVEFSRPIYPEQFPKNEEGARLITQAYTAILEGWIRQRPDQWFWLHRRWKTRPKANFQKILN